MSTVGTATERGDLAEQRVTPLELFFDLVFVFALTQVTAFLADHLTWTGMLQGAALLVVLWWAWGGYSWLTNAVPAEEVIPARLVILTAMAAMLVASLAVPDAFGEYGVLFGLAYFVVRLLHVVLFVFATGNTPETHQAILRLTPGFLIAPVLLVVAGFLDGFAQGALWAMAITIDLGVSLVRGVSGFRVHAEHFVERYGLIVIIALGESIVAIGVGASGEAIGAGVAVAAVLGIALAAGMWWAYFDLVMLVAGRRISTTKGEERARLARDAYSYLHLPMVAGIVLVALGIKTTLAHVEDPLGTIPAVALCGGVALYLLGHNAFRLRDVGSVSVPRLVVTLLCCALIPLAMSVPSLITLAILAVLVCTLAAFETVRSREFRRELRAG
ncbi:MAG: possible low temperature requirement protein A [uncultured Rubrobacteraceae bacterium]|uniref:Possible low temperature requirement protein A n=1 Tax=uncultured Rubrobacteraceae bacterium TaxID=349277 RepID=A0A6J4QXG9_9ACTN|nr:MAG: possible low temperature requirement protein A [uncultured Rubrobacteraceae bacterium]